MARISVIMPVYNAEKYLKNAIESILSQTYTDFEFLIANDGSIDNSRNIIESFSDTRIRVIHYNQNIGLIEVLNKSIKEASGEYIARMDSDDIADPRRLELQAKWLDEHTDCDVVASVVQQIDSNGNAMPSWDVDLKTTTRDSIKATLVEENCIAHPSIMARSQVLRKNPYSHKALHAEDYELWLRLVSSGHNIDKLPAPLLNYRIHSNSVTSQSNSNSWKSSQKVLRAKKAFLLNSFSQMRFSQLEWKTLLSILRTLKSHLKLLTLKTVKSIVRSLIFKSGQLSIFVKPILFRTELVLFFPHYHVGGAEKVHVDIATTFKEKKPFIFITYPSKDDSELSKFRTAGTVHEFGKKLRFRVLEIFLLGRISNAINQDKKIKTIAGSNTDFFYHLLPLLRLDLRKVDLLHTFGSGIEEYTLPYVKHLDQRIVINENVRSSLKQQYKIRNLDEKFASRISLIENRITIPNGPFPKNDLPPLKVLYVGRGSPEKRIDLIAKVAEFCVKNETNAEFTFVGPGIESYVSQERLKYCKFAGVITDPSALEQQYRNAHIIILLSTFEGFPIVVMEAMACGVVPVVTNVGGLNVHVKPAETGFLIENSSDEQKIISDTAAILKNLMDVNSPLKQMSKTCIKYAQEIFAQPNYREKYRAAILDERIDF